MFVMNFLHFGLRTTDSTAMRMNPNAMFQNISDIRCCTYVFNVYELAVRQ